MMITRITYPKLIAQQSYRLFSVSSNPEEFVKNRSQYQDKLSDLRKEWQEEFKLRKQREAEQAIAERQRIVLQKAVTLREKRKQSVIRQEKARKARELDYVRYRTKLANTQLIREKKLNDQQARYAAVIAEMEKEKHCWITLENMDSKITEELFAKPSTTGLISRYSEHWRYHLVTTSLGRLLQAKKNDDPDQVRSPLTERLSLMAQASLTKRMVVEEVLDDMIGTGEERAKYKEIVEMYTKTLDDLGNFKNMEEYHLFNTPYDGGVAVDESREEDHHDLMDNIESEEDNELLFKDNLDDDDIIEEEPAGKKKGKINEKNAAKKGGKKGKK